MVRFNFLNCLTYNILLVSCVQSSDLIFLWIVRTTKSYYSVTRSIPWAVHCTLMTCFINGTLRLSAAFIFFTFFCHPPPPGLPLLAQLVKNLSAMWKTQVGSLGWEDPLEKEMATHSSILAWRIPMDRGAWWATVHGVTESQTRLSD